MKKLIASLMAIGMMCGAGASAFAAEITQDKNPEDRKADVPFTYIRSSAAYTITIPDTVELNGNNTSGAADIDIVKFDVKVDDIKGMNAKTLSISVPKSTLLTHDREQNITATVDLSAEAKLDNNDRITIDDSTDKLVASIVNADNDEVKEIEYTAEVKGEENLTVGETYTAILNFEISVDNT